MADIGKDIDRAADLLMADHVVAIPTETVYGLAGNALSETAIRRIFEAKKRPFTDPLIVHLPDVDAVAHYVKEVPPLVYALFQAFSPGPLTVLLPKNEIIPDIVTNGSPLVAVRIPSHPVALALLRQLPFPLVAPSANLFGQLSPTLAQHVQAGLGHAIPYILEGGPCQIGVESTIVQVDAKDHLRVLRQGGIAEEDLHLVVQLAENEDEKTPTVPGSMESHYAPGVPLHIGLPQDFVSEALPPSSVAFIGFQRLNDVLPHGNQRILSPDGNLKEAAKNLFRMLHELDKGNFACIIAEPLPDAGVGKAINDRLKRAAAKRNDRNY